MTPATPPPTDDSQGDTMTPVETTTETKTTPPSKSRPAWQSRRTMIIAGAAALLVLIAVAVPLIITGQQHAAAQARYDSAAKDFASARTEVLGAVEEFETVKDTAGESRVIAMSVLQVASADYADGAALGQLSAANASLTEVLDVAAAAEAATASVPSKLGDAPEETETLDKRARALGDVTDGLRARSDELAGLMEDLESAAEPVDAAGEALVASLPGSAAAVEAVYPSAANDARLDYRSAAAELSEAAWDTELSARVWRYTESAVALTQSHAAEEAEKAGPLYGPRKEVEAFARSLAGGVMLDFNWAPIVNGYGTGGSYGGYGTWNTNDGGYSTISLSDSVASMWHTNPAVKSLVAHEVGHSITSKCYELYRDGFGSQDETFATAWAIGMGYSLNGSGESIYGRPSDAQIELSKQCR